MPESTCSTPVSPTSDDPNGASGALQKQVGSKVEVHSLAFACSDAFAYDNGTYTQTENGQSIEGNYLVVLFWKDGKWLIVQHASTAKRRLN